MKYFHFVLFIVSMILSANVSFAQIAVGAGYLYQNLNEKVEGSSSGAHTAFNGLYAGFDFGIRCGKVFSIVPGIYYEFMNGGQNIMDYVGAYGVKWQEHYLKIPVDFRFGFDAGRNIRIFAGSGPKFHIGLGSKIRGAVETLDFYDYMDEYTGVAKAYGRFDVLLGFNAGVEIFRHYRISLGYDYGLLNRTKNVRSNVAHNNQFCAGVAYVF